MSDEFYFTEITYVCDILRALVVCYKDVLSWYLKDERAKFKIAYFHANMQTKSDKFLVYSLIV